MEYFTQNNGFSWNFQPPAYSNLAETATKLKNHCRILTEKACALTPVLQEIKLSLSFTSPISPKTAGAVTSGKKKLGAFALSWQGPHSVREIETTTRSFSAAKLSRMPFQLAHKDVFAQTGTQDSKQQIGLSIHYKKTSVGEKMENSKEDLPSRISSTP